MHPPWNPKKRSCLGEESTANRRIKVSGFQLNVARAKGCGGNAVIKSCFEGGRKQALYLNERQT